MRDAADPYAVLGVPRTADEAAIKAAFRKVALTAHPDRCGPGASPEARAAAAARFAAASAAHDLLTDATQRRLYDLGAHPTTPSGRPRPPHPAYAGAGTAAHNPFGGGWTRRPGGPRPPPRPPGWWSAAARAVAARSTRGDAAAHAALAALLLFGVGAVGGVADAAWGAANRGKLWEDVEARRRQRREGG